MSLARGGFTLVEVVVALSILSLILLVTVTGLRTLANTQVAIERMTDRVDELRTVSSFLRDTMETAVVGGSGGGLTLGGSGDEGGFFEMTPASLAWKSTVQFGESFGGSYLVRVAREDDLLVLRWQRPNRAGRPGDWAEAEARTLVPELEEFVVSWRGAYEDEWLLDWGRGDVPGWVRLQLRTAGRYWPDLIMQVPR